MLADPNPNKVLIWRFRGEVVMVVVDAEEGYQEVVIRMSWQLVSAAEHLL